MHMNRKKTRHSFHIFRTPYNHHRIPGCYENMTDENPEVRIDRALELLFHASTGSTSFVLSDARQNDCPIVYASANFFELTGYSPSQGRMHGCLYTVSSSVMGVVVFMVAF